MVNKGPGSVGYVIHAELSTTQRYADMTANDLRAAIALLGKSRGNGRSEQLNAAMKPPETCEVSLSCTNPRPVSPKLS